jgi:hypothetical protein
VRSSCNSKPATAVFADVQFTGLSLRRS